MDELGHILREARETKGFTLAEVQENTRINVKYLAALEDGDYEALPTATHVRGFLRNYARFLGLDPEPLLNRYLLHQGNRPHPISPRVDPGLSHTAPLPLPQDYKEQVFFDPVNMQVNNNNASRDSESALRLVIIAALIIAIALIATRIPQLLNNEDLADGIDQAIQSVLDTNVEPSASEQTADNPLITTEPITSTSRNDIIANDFPTPFPTRPPLPATLETIRLRLEITERVWMEVTIDGDVVFTGLANKDDPPYEWEAEEEAKVVTGNAIGIFVTINDVKLGRMGERGENKEEVWRTTQ